MLMTVPRNLAALVKTAARLENSRYAAMTGIEFVDQGNGLYQATATDGRVLACIAGPFDEPQRGFPFEPDDAKRAVFDATDFANAIRGIQPYRKDDPRVSLATGQGDQAAVFYGGIVQPVSICEGRYPDVSLVYPMCGPFVRFRVNPKKMINLLQAAAAVNEEAVEILYYRPGKPVGIIAMNSEGQAFDGLIVPLSPPETPAKPKVHNPEDDSPAGESE